MSRERKPIVNVYCASRGEPWLFTDLLRHFAAAGAVTSPEPLPDADAWVCIRTDEWRRSPDLSRTVLQIHDLFDRALPAHVGALVRTHPDQPFTRSFDRLLTRPIGPMRMFRLRERMPHAFTVGWVGRPCGWQGREIRSPAPLVSAAIELHRQGLPIRVILAGAGLESARDRLSEAGVVCLHFPREEYPVETYPGIYAEMDALVITSSIEAGPMPLFEALACGVPVFSTPVGWARELLPPEWIYDPASDSLVDLLARASGRRAERFGARAAIRERIIGRRPDPCLEDWIAANLRLAEGPCSPRPTT